MSKFGNNNSGFFSNGGGGGGGGGTTNFYELQFTVGDVDSPIIAGDTALQIDALSTKQNSVLVFLDGNLIMKNLADRISYTIVYNATNFIIYFNYGVVDSQTYYIQYATS